MDQSQPSTDAEFRNDLCGFYLVHLDYVISPEIATAIIIHRMDSFSLAYDHYINNNEHSQKDVLIKIAIEAAELMQRLKTVK